MRFAIDFDGTFARDPVMFRRLVGVLREHGHDAVLVTGRSDEGRWGAEVRREVGNLMPIVFTDGGWKSQAAADAGYRVDVWLDDQPQCVAPQDPRLVVGKTGGSP